ncbi:MAG TPA: PD-(D/E)XK nuclease family protein [Casimicrobiaceae bacterium]|jgi:probable DNA repair protein
MNALLSALAAGAMAVTPNRRLARRLHADFDAAMAAAGRRSWATPTILAYSTWVAFLWDGLLAHDAGSEGRSLLSASQAMGLWELVIEDSGTRLADTRGAAALASQAWSLVHAWGAGGPSWRSWAREGDEQDPSMFAAWAETYIARQRRLGVLDIAQAPDVIAAQAATIAGAHPPLWIAGFLERAPQQQRLFAAVASSGVAVREFDPLPEGEMRVTRTIAATPRDEIAAALGWARAMVLARPGIRVGIVVEDLAARRDAVVALAQDILDPASILPDRGHAAAPFEISLGVRLAAVPVIASALDLIALSGAPVPVGAAAALLRSPYLPASEASWQRLGTLERKWLEDGVRTVSLNDAIAATTPLAPELAARWQHGRDAKRAPRVATPREWADRWREWLAHAGWPGTRPLDSAEYQAREAWEALLRDFVALGAVTPRQDSVAAVRALHALASETIHQPEGGDASIQILGVLEAAGLGFDALWVAGLSADRWPAAPRPNPLLPIGWQRERGVPRATAQRELEYARMLTARLARGAAEVVLSSSAGTDDPPISPSALLLAYPQSPLPPLPESWSASMLRAAEFESFTDERAPPIPEGTTIRGGARAIQTQSDCPFQAVARHRLGAQRWPTVKPGLAASERGQLVHATLASFWTAVADRAGLLALDADALDAEIATAVGKGLACLPPVRWRNVPDAVRGAESRRLDRLLRAWLSVERARPPFTIAAIEARRELVLHGVGLRMRVDRIDALEDGGLAIIDYKTGALEQPRQWFDDRPRASQLGTYTLAQRASEPGVAVRAVANVELRTASIAASGLAADSLAWPALPKVTSIRDLTDWRSLEAWWETHLGALAAELAAGVATVTPRPKPSPCRICGFQAFCRIETVRFDEPENDGEV